MQLMTVGAVPKNPKWAKGPHKHPFVEVICFHEGRGDVWVRGRPYSPKAGSVLIYRPGETHWERSDRRCPHYSVYVGVRLQDSLADLGTHVLDDTGEIRWLSRALLRETGSDVSDGASELARCYLAALIQLLKRSKAAVESGKDGLDWPVEAKRFIEEHFDDPSLDRSSVAKHVGISVSSLAHGFSESFGESPFAYLQHVRLETAAARLVDTDLLVKEIAGMVGYKDPYYFSRVFRDRFGCSPSAYRARRPGVVEAV